MDQNTKKSILIKEVTISLHFVGTSRKNLSHTQRLHAVIDA